VRVVLEARKVLCLDDRSTVSRWVAIEDGKIAATGGDEPPSGYRRVSVDGVVLPGFIDAHVHLTTTGMYRRGLDLRDCRSVNELLERVGRFVNSSQSNWIIGGNFDPGRNEEGRMPDRQELDRVGGDKVLLISRTDGHSCAVNSAALERLGDPEAPGYGRDDAGSPSGILANQANYRARSKFFDELPDEEVRSAQVEGCREALEYGTTSVHEMAGGEERDFRILLSHLSELPVAVRPYFSTLEVARAAEAGLSCVGGDLFLDGSIGSRTAAMSKPYNDSDGTGALYHSDEEITEFFAEATRRGMQAGVHAIGDAAIEQGLRCMEAALWHESRERLLALRHRIEHFECVTPDHLERAARLGIVASVQPMFDRYWGGEGMYAVRLGDRAATMNPFAKMLALGIAVAGGSDSTVTPLNPLMGISAAAGHHVSDFAVSNADALRMFTIWAAFAGREERNRGSIEAGKQADFCVLPEDPSLLSPAELESLEVMETWVSGVKVWPEMT
jgi:predicted amidohydrolase YtcJ